MRDRALLDEWFATTSFDAVVDPYDETMSEWFLREGSSAPLPGGTPDKDNWVDEQGGLPRYVRRVARELMKRGMPKQQAIATAISRIKYWAATSDDPAVRAKAAAAVAHWEKMKSSARAS